MATTDTNTQTGTWADRVLSWESLAHGNPHRLPGSTAYTGTFMLPRCGLCGAVAIAVLGAPFPPPGPWLLAKQQTITGLLASFPWESQYSNIPSNFLVTYAD